MINTDFTSSDGVLGLSPGTSIPGLDATALARSVSQTDAAVLQAEVDASTVYTPLALLPFTSDLSCQNLRGLTSTPGLYDFDSSAQLTGALIRDALGAPDAFFVFQIGSVLTTASGPAVNVLGSEIIRAFKQVGTSATLGTGTSFAGSILALASLTMKTSAAIPCGRHHTGFQNWRQ